MATVSFRVPDEIKEKMDAHDEINWSAVLRQEIEEAIADLEHRNVAHAVATSERLSQAIDTDDVAEENTADVIREFRDTRYGGESA
jgi:predicted DNA-binding protein